MLSERVVDAMGRGRAIGMMVGSIIALSATSLFVLSETPADPDDSTEQMMTYLSLALFVMALALVGPLSFAIVGRGSRPAANTTGPTDPPGEVEEEEASDIELEFRALEMELDREERG